MASSNKGYDVISNKSKIKQRVLNQNRFATTITRYQTRRSRTAEMTWAKTSHTQAVGSEEPS
ncbi:MAG: hypothetical protein ACR2L1_10920 [Pyrinomonadaceae bacterium]